ncbi:MAG: hypothetical protein HY047_12000 [Acidobacteria bacterium]|nr:hypothetical protein [Acidobacteriota bacterium]
MSFFKGVCMRTRIQTAMLAVAATVTIGGAALGAKTTTVTGTVGDAMCGTKHMMAGDAAGCTRECVKKGSDYALIVKDKVYTLKAHDTTKADLDKLAGKMAKVVGDLNGETIQVTSVQAAK